MGEPTYTAAAAAGIDHTLALTTDSYRVLADNEHAGMLEALEHTSGFADTNADGNNAWSDGEETSPMSFAGITRADDEDIDTMSFASERDDDYAAILRANKEYLQQVCGLPMIRHIDSGASFIGSEAASDNMSVPSLCAASVDSYDADKDEPLESVSSDAGMVAQTDPKAWCSNCNGHRTYRTHAADTTPHK
jgi:hypothetical protein